jgi:hypothetical protein
MRNIDTDKLIAAAKKQCPEDALVALGLMYEGYPYPDCIGAAQPAPEGPQYMLQMLDCLTTHYLSLNHSDQNVHALASTIKCYIRNLGVHRQVPNNGNLSEAMDLLHQMATQLGETLARDAVFRQRERLNWLLARTLALAIAPE